MEKNFWLDKWQQGQIGFHMGKVMPWLQKYWPSLNMPDNSKVVVPLAGKSMDVAWLAGIGHQVYAIELSPLAVEQFFTEHGLKPQITASGKHTIYKAGNITYICGDIFALEASFFQQFDACYDRAALIALPEPMRAQYVKHVYGNLANKSNTLLITIDYQQEQMSGPPFAINTDMVQQLFASKFRIEELESRDILANEPKFKERGLSQMFTRIYKLKNN